MQKQLTDVQNDKSIFFNRLAYGLLVLVAIVMVLMKDYSTAVTNFALALVFDPFNQTVPWGKRTLYQRAWLIIHLLLALAGFGLLLFS